MAPSCQAKIPIVKTPMEKPASLNAIRLMIDLTLQIYVTYLIIHNVEWFRALSLLVFVFSAFP